MTTLDELLATMAEDAGTARRPAAQPPPIPKRIEEQDLDDGPILTSDRLWPAALPQPKRKGPPPPPPGRRARGTAPLGEPEAAVAEIAAPAAILARGTEPVDRVELEDVPTGGRRQTASAGLARRGAVIVSIAVALVGGAVLAGTLLQRADRDERAAVAAPEPVPADPAAEPAVAAAPAAEPAVATDPEPEISADLPPEVRVIPLPTEVTEVARPAPAVAARPRIRRPVSPPPPVRARAVAGALPVRPTNSEISSAVVAVQHRLNGCGTRHGTTGAVPVKIRVAPSGAIASIAVEQGSAPFRSCVASALGRQRLPASQVGTTASFPVLIR